MENYDQIVYPIMYFISRCTSLWIGWIFGYIMATYHVDKNKKNYDFWWFGYLHLHMMGLTVMIYRFVDAIYGL